MKDKDKELIKEAIGDWEKGKLSCVATMVVISSIVDPQEVTEDALEWGRQTLKRLREKEGYGC